MANPNIEILISKLDIQGDKRAQIIIAKFVKIGKPTVPQLMRAANDLKKPRIRKWSLQALGAIGDVRAAPLLLKALDDDLMTVRLHSLKGLAKMKYKAGVNKIAKLLKDESGGIRVNALYALIEIDDASVLPQIEKCLSDKSWYVRQNACVACGKFKTKKALRKLKGLSVNDERKAVREAAKQALYELV